MEVPEAGEGVTVGAGIDHLIDHHQGVVVDHDHRPCDVQPRVSVMGADHPRDGPGVSGAEQHGGALMVQAVDHDHVVRPRRDEVAEAQRVAVGVRASAVDQRAMFVDLERDAELIEVAVQDALAVERHHGPRHGPAPGRFASS